MIIQKEKLTRQLIDDAEEIILRNYEETGQLTNDLDIDWDLYMLLKDTFVAFVMRDEKSKIVGILFFVVAPYPHVKTLTMAQQITFYINRDFRRYSAEMMKFSEDYLISEGIKIITQSARFNSHFCKTLEQRGYEKADITFIKRIV